MFQATWEKTSVTHQLPDGMLEKMVSFVYPDQELTAFELIAGGCANLNFKIQLEDDKHPLIFRVYLRDKDAAYRKQKLAALLRKSLPVPLTHYIGKLEGLHFAITEFIPGMPLGDFLLKNTPDAISTIMYEVGTILSKINAHEFPRAGFLNHELEVIPYASSDVTKFAQDCLTHSTVLSVLDPPVISEIQTAIEQGICFFWVLSLGRCEYA